MKMQISVFICSYFYCYKYYNRRCWTL